MALGSIVVSLRMQTADFETDAGRASKVAQKRAKEIDAAFKKAGVAIGLALGAAIVGIAAGVKNAIDKMDDMSKAAQRVGLSSEEFSRLAYAGSLADVEMGTLVSTLGKLTKSQAAAYNVTSQQAKVFDALGIAAFDAGGKMRSSTDVLMDFADRFKQMQGSPEIMAAGFALFGRSFQDMIPLIKDGAAGLREAAAEADRLGITLDTDAGKAAEKFNDDITRLQTAVNGFWQEIAIGMLPALDEGITKINKMAGEGDLARNAVTLLSGAFSLGVGALEAYNNAVARVSISMGIYAGVAAGALEISKNMLSLGFADGGFTGGIDKMTGAFQQGQKELDLLIAKQNGWSEKMTGAALFPVPGTGQNKPFPFKQGAPDAFNFAADAQSRAAAKAVIDQKKLADALGNNTAPNGAGGGKSKAAELTDEQKALKSLNEDYARTLESGRERLAMMGLETESARMLWEVEEGRFATLLPNQKAELVALAELSDAKQLRLDEIEKETRAMKDAEEGYKRAIEDIRSEAETLGMTNEQLEIYNRLKYAGIEANSAFGQSIIAEATALQGQRAAMDMQIEGMDILRNNVSDFVTDLRHGEDAWDSLRKAAANFFDEIAAAIQKQLLAQLFGQPGTNQTGSAGGGWAGLVMSFASAFFGGGKSGGGYTGAGGVNEYAGPVHKGEVVWSQSDVARAGGVSAVESARMSGGGTGGGSRKPQRIVIVDSQKDGEAMLRSSTGEDAVLVHIGNNARAVRELLA